METKRKKCRVIILPTETNNTGDIIMASKNDEKSYAINSTCNGLLLSKSNKHWQLNHLYIISNDEIKEGDWYINLDDNKISQDIPHLANNAPSCKKIIATTDKSLIQKKKIIGKDEIGNLYNNIYLPQPSKAFIKEYCKVGGINEVMVEYYLDQSNSITMNLEDYTPKVNSHNEIIIHLIKENWTREELLNIVETEYSSVSEKIKIKQFINNLY